jgi:hypothetical protein
VSNSTNIALEIQEAERTIASLRNSSDPSAIHKISFLYSKIAELIGEKAGVIAREEAAKEAKEEATRNALNFLEGFSNLIEPVIQSYIESGSKKFDDILERNKDKLKYTEEELRIAREEISKAGFIGAATEDMVLKKAQQNFLNAGTKELTDGYTEVKELSIGIFSSEPKTRDEALQLMLADVETFGELTEEQKLLLSQMSDAEKELLILNALGAAEGCVGEGMEQFEENLKIYKDTPSCALRANFSEVIKFDFTRAVKEYLDSAKNLEKQEQEKLQEIYKAAGITEGVSLDKLNLSKEALVGLAEITEVLRLSGNALDTKNTEHTHLNSLIADFERLAQEAREQKPDLALRK